MEGLVVVAVVNNMVVDSSIGHQLFHYSVFLELQMDILRKFIK
jgi:hypothetical protein